MKKLKAALLFTCFLLTALWGSEAFAASGVTINDLTNVYSAAVDANGLHVVCTTGCGGAGTSSNSSSAATSSTNLPTLAFNYLFNGTTWDQAQDDGSKNLKVNCMVGCSAAPAATPIGGAVTVVTTGGTAVTAVAANANGCYIQNPVSATDENIGAAEPLYINPVTSATTSNNISTVAIAPGGSWNCIPKSTLGVSVNAASSGHKFAVVSW